MYLDPVISPNFPPSDVRWLRERDHVGFTLDEVIIEAALYLTGQSRSWKVQIHFPVKYRAQISSTPA